MTLDLSAYPPPSGTRKPRNWPQYNERLIQRGEFDLFLDSLPSWEKELRDMNKNKRGASYKYPASLMLLAKLLRCQFNIPYRTLEGILRSLGKILGFDAPSYTTLFSRLSTVDLQDLLPPLDLGSDLVLAVDASRMKIDKYGGWMRQKWADKSKKRRGWIKMHIIADVKTHAVVDVQITEETVGDQPMFIPLVRNSLEKGAEITQVLGDGIFDTRAIHNFLAAHQILPGIPPRKNASRRSRGCPARAAEVRLFQDYGEPVWKRLRQYQHRWSVERSFGTFKQLFGETVMA